MKFLSVEKRCPVAILFVNVSLATVTSSKLNVENSTKARYIDETHSYRFLKFEINQIKEFHENDVKSQEVIKNNIKVYNKKVIALVWEYIVLNEVNTIYSHTSAITYNIHLIDLWKPCLYFPPEEWEKELNFSSKCLTLSSIHILIH